MSKIVLRPSLLKIRRLSLRWIILHDTYEIYKRPELEIDNSRYQFPFLTRQVTQQKAIDINYHYIIEKSGDDFIAIASRPLLYLCDWPDIDPSVNNRSIHIAFLGSYEYKIPELRSYQIAAYRVITPIMKLYALAQSRLKTHSEVSNNKELKCPGQFFDKDLLISQVRRFWIR